MLKVLMANGEPVTFPEGAQPDVNDQTGRLYISIGGVDVAVFADRGWLMYGRPIPKQAEAEEDTSDWRDDLDDEV